MDTSKDAKGVVSTAKQSPRPGGHSGKGGLMAAVGPISYLHGYTNAQGGTLPDCGQAAISTALDAWQYNPYSLDRTTQDSADSQYYWDNDTIVEAVENQYPNRVVPFFNNQVGMFPEDIMAALQALSGGNCHLERCYSGAFGIGWESNWAMLQSRMQSGTPTIVLLDAGALGYGWLEGHWVVAYNYDPSPGVCITNSPTGSAWIPEATFLDAWFCKAYPYMTNHTSIDFWPNPAQS